MNYFKITEFFFPEDYENMTPEKVLDVCEKLLKYHYPILNKMRDELNHPIFINAGYRSYDWELSKGRSGTSQHTFEDLGAVDISTPDVLVLNQLLELAKLSPYKRVCFYPRKGFIHCDMKGDRYHSFIDYSDGKGWQYAGKRNI